MRNVDIEIFQIAKTVVDRDAVRRWLDFIDANGYELPTDATDPALLVALAAKRCYKSFVPGLNKNVTKVRSDMTEYLDNVLKQGHGSVLEHAVFTFAIENVSRVFTAEMNRHRAGVAISEASMRYIRYSDIPWWMPPSMRLAPDDTIALSGKKLATQAVFKDHYTQTEVNYDKLQEIWKDELDPSSKFKGKKEVTSMMRRIIPMGVATGGVWTMNVRAVRHILAMRASTAAEEEIAYVFCRVAKMIVEQEPMLLGDFKENSDGFWSPQYVKV